jgi:undecaprenyl diphosphate synthase
MVIADGPKLKAGLVTRGMPREFQEISRAAFKMGIPYFTFWAASEKNLIGRDPTEVRFLVSLFCEKLESERTFKECSKYGVRVKVSGRWNEILKNERLLRAITAIERKTQMFNKHYLTLPFGYSGKQEMLLLIRDFCERALYGKSSPTIEELNGRMISGSPPVDLIIRTGACEEGLNWSHNSSGFMMWLAADAKVFSPPTLWPDFTVEMFRKTIVDYSKALRRFGT